MKKLLLVLMANGCAFSLIADPGNGIVKDSKGTIYYTDLGQVWKIAPNGKKTIAVQGVHTHELYIDWQDNLYGEHLWYNGEKLNTWGNYVWRLRNNGILDTLAGPKEGFQEDYAFNQDAAGNMYWIQRWKIKRIIRKNAAGSITVMAEGAFNHISRLHVTKHGVIYFIADNRLYKVPKPGELVILIQHIENEDNYVRIKNTPGNSLNNIWVNHDTVYISNYTGRKTIRWVPGNKMVVVYKSPFPWSPSGGLVDDRGNLWVMEYNITNEVRVKKIHNPLPENAVKAAKKAEWKWMIMILTGSTITGLFTYLYLKKKKSPENNTVKPIAL
jgi:hypothetical protein